MTQQFTSTDSKRTLPIAGQREVNLDIEAELAQFESNERERLGLGQTEHWREEMVNLGFTAAERGSITLLIGGLTFSQDQLAEAGLRSIGYNVVAMDCPDNDALQLGKEFGNRAQCNPTYFTVGNLIKYLLALRDEKGMSSSEIVDKFVLVTPGACGPCRFGMYVTEYRKALRDAGFDGFRVMMFQQQGGLNQATGEEAGLDLNPKFFITLVRSLLAGDILNGLAYRIRPYEVTPGDTDKAFKESMAVCYEALENNKSVLAALWKSRSIFGAVKVDRARLRPKVGIIGEFWAMTTEGDGNYALQKFVQDEGAEADVQFLCAWLLYNVWEVSFDTKNRADLRGTDSATLGLESLGEYGVFTRKLALWGADKGLRLLFQTFAHAGGFTGYHLPDMTAVAEVAAPYYNNDLRGGEGHMEVGKLILNVVHQKATMTLSVKPFGCMPSSGVSDGVQSIIAERFPGTIFCAVETSGDGAVNFYSRCQMYLFKAKQAAQKEFDEALAQYGMTEEQFQTFVAGHKRFSSSLYKPSHSASTTTTDLVHEVGKLLTTTRRQRFQEKAAGLLASARKVARDWAENGPERVRVATDVSFRAALELTEIAKEKAPSVAADLQTRAQNKAAEVLPFVKPVAVEAAPIAAE